MDEGQLARAIDVACAMALAIAEDDSHGYTQGPGRLGPTSFDCFGLCRKCYLDAGLPMGGATFTGDIIPELMATGRYVRLPYSRASLRRGDLEVKPKILDSAGKTVQTGHVAICIDDRKSPKVIVEAYSNEFGGIVGGVPGDQTGREIRAASDWGFGTSIIRPVADAKPKPTVVPKKGPDEEVPMPVRQGTVRRLYNPNTGDHVLTTDANEAKSLPKSGWKDEGAVGVAPEGYAVLYRFVDADTGEHLWTDDYVEARDLLRRGQNLSDGTKRGWQFEGESMVVHEGGQGAVKVHRLYKSGCFHLLTADANEIATLAKQGWKDEGVKFSLDAV